MYPMRKHLKRAYLGNVSSYALLHRCSYRNVVFVKTFSHVKIVSSPECFVKHKK